MMLMKKLISKIVFTFGLLLALTPVYALGIVLIEMIDIFSMVRQAEGSAELDLVEPIKNAIFAVIIVLPGYIGAAILLIPLVRWGELRMARIVRNTLFVTSAVVLISVPVGTVVTIITLISIFFFRSKFRV